MARMPNCAECHKPLPTTRRVEVRNSGRREYTVTDDSKIVSVYGIRYHQHCAALTRTKEKHDG